MSLNHLYPPLHTVSNPVKGNKETSLNPYLDITGMVDCPSDTT